MLRKMLIRSEIHIALTISINFVGDYLFSQVNKTQSIYHQFCSFKNIQDLQLMENYKYIPSHFSQEYHITCEILLALSVKHVRISDKDGANKIGINIK